MNEYKFNDLFLDKYETFGTTILPDMMDQFLFISGDSNPLHQDIEYATAHGFKDRVVYGLLTSTFYSTFVGVYLPGKYALLHGLKKINFLKPVFIGDHLNIHGKVVYINEAYKVVEIKAWITNQNEEIVSNAIIAVGLLE